MKSLSPSQIGRKLAISYVLVTVGTVLVLEAILLIGALGFAVWFFTSSELLPDLLAREARMAASEIKPFFETLPPDTKGLERWLMTRRSNSPGQGVSLEWQSTPMIKGKERGRIISPVWVILDRQGRIITSNWPARFVSGSAFRDPEIDEAGPLVSRALRGEEELSSLRLRDKNLRLPAVAYPIKTKGVVGALYVRVTGRLDAPVPLWRGSADFLWPLVISGIVLLIVTTPLGLLFGRLTARPFARYLESLARQNARLTAQSQELAAIQERNRIARELHDSVNQELFGIAMRTAAIRELHRRDPDLTERHLDELEEMIRGVQKEMRSLILQLRPPALREEGLIPALADHIRAFAEREGTGVEWKVSGHEGQLSPAVEDAIFRITQEALGNVVRHANARHVELQLDYRPGEVAISITDDGEGFDPGSLKPGSGFGLVSMQERAELAGGKLIVTSAPNEGTRVEAVFPRENG